ncbi:unnamed protein product [Phytomonas sp. EM1]|nr:unnamed protein product [Phytomonas sp. EM1]|eukprot:CCW65632.1 unnamed protein product [Phytomonas sp. isolate EM1]
MQLGHLKEVVQNITDGTQLEFQLQRCQEAQGVVVLDIYNTEWGSCRALGETFKRLYTDFGNEIDIRFFSVECDSIMKNLDDAVVVKKKTSHKTVEYYEDTKSSFWGPILKRRCGHSKPCFILYKEGRMRGQIEGVDTPNICKLIGDLCKPDPITQCLTNPDGLKFWKEHFQVTKTNIPFASFIEAVEKALNLTLTPQKILVLKNAVGAENGVCTATGLQAWLKDNMTLSEQLDKIVNAPDNEAVDEGTDVKAVDDSASENPVELSHSGKVEKGEDGGTERTDEIGEAEVPPQEAQISSSGVTGEKENEREQPSQTIEEVEKGEDGGTERTDEIGEAEVPPQEAQISSSGVTVEEGCVPTDNTVREAESQADPRGSGAYMSGDAVQLEDSGMRKEMTSEGSVAITDASQNPGKMNQIFIDRWITVTEDELSVWNKIADLPLHYPPPSTAPLEITCEEAAERAHNLILNADKLPTLAEYLQESGLNDVQISMMCLAAHQKVGSESPSYGKLSLILMTSHPEELVGLFPEPAEPVAELAKGTLLETHGPLGFSALCLCTSEVFPDEAFFYIPPPPLADRLSKFVVGNEVPLPALTPLQTSNLSEDSISMKIVGLPNVIELASTDESDYTVVLSQWFANLQIIDKTETLLTAQFVEFLFEEEYVNFSNTYVERLIQDENKLDKKLSNRSPVGMEDNAE